MIVYARPCSQMTVLWPSINLKELIGLACGIIHCVRQCQPTNNDPGFIITSDCSLIPCTDLVKPASFGEHMWFLYVFVWYTQLNHIYILYYIILYIHILCVFSTQLHLCSTQQWNLLTKFEPHHDEGLFSQLVAPGSNCPPEPLTATNCHIETWNFQSQMQTYEH